MNFLSIMRGHFTTSNKICGSFWDCLNSKSSSWLTDSKLIASETFCKEPLHSRTRLATWTLPLNGWEFDTRHDTFARKRNSTKADYTSNKHHPKHLWNYILKLKPMSIYAMISTTSTKLLKGKRRIKLTFQTSMLPMGKRGVCRGMRGRIEWSM